MTVLHGEDARILILAIDKIEANNFSQEVRSLGETVRKGIVHATVLCSAFNGM